MDSFHHATSSSTESPAPLSPAQLTWAKFIGRASSTAVAGRNEPASSGRPYIHTT